METRANHFLVGAFTLGVLVAAFLFVYWFRIANQQGARADYRVVFIGSVSGLSKGSVVRFNGLRVGEVTSVDLLPDDPSRVTAVIAVDANTPVKNDTRARLEYQGLTGVASVQLTGGTNTAQALRNPDNIGAPTIYADRSDFQDLYETAQRLSGRLDGILARTEKVLSDNETGIASTVRNIEIFSQALANNASGIAAFLSSAGDTSQNITALAQKMTRLSGEAEDFLKNIDAKSVNRTIVNIEAVSQTFSDNRTSLQAIMTDTALLAKRLNETTGKLDGALTDIAQFAKALDTNKINATLDGAQKFTATLGNNAAGIDVALKDVGEITRKVSESAGKLDSVMSAAENFFGGGEGKGVMKDITETSKAIRILAQNLDKRTGEITTGVNRFTGPGLREFEALMSEMRKSVGDIGRAARNLERNPQQIITGGRPNLPEYGSVR